MSIPPSSAASDKPDARKESHLDGGLIPHDGQVAGLEALDFLVGGTRQVLVRREERVGVGGPSLVCSGSDDEKRERATRSRGDGRLGAGADATPPCSYSTSGLRTSPRSPPPAGPRRWPRSPPGTARPGGCASRCRGSASRCTGSRRSTPPGRGSRPRGRPTRASRGGARSCCGKSDDVVATLFFGTPKEGGVL